MKGGTLVASRAVKLHSYYKGKLEDLGFKGVHMTAVENDGLNMLIRELMPKIMVIGSGFYKCVTPYRVADLHERFPDLNIAAVSLSDFPAELAMNFIFNGAKSYVSLWEGIDEFYKGINKIKNGKEYISPEVKERIELHSKLPKAVVKITKQQMEVIRLMANGFSVLDMAKELYISERTVYKHKENIFNSLNLQNDREVIRAANELKIINMNELFFYGRDYLLHPKTINKE
jgi:DNA-binding NarL/FixJ family response regulator